MCTWRAVNHGLCEKPRIVKSKPMIVNFKTRFRVETYDCRLTVHLASIKIEKPRFISCIRFLNELIRNLGLSMRNPGLPIENHG